MLPAMNPSKTEPYHHHLLDRPIIIPSSQSQPSIHDDINDFVLFPSSPDSSSSNDAVTQTLVIDPNPHISTQFYTFNSESHSLMIRCLLQTRPATPDEIRSATPFPVLATWRSVWKDRNQDTAYLTAWKRIQDKLAVSVAPDGSHFLIFKNNPNQFVSHFNQWQEIVTRVHSDGGSKHLPLKETIEKIRQVWTVGAKFYGIPESFIKVCVNECPICSDSSGSNQKSKRRRFEYTESFDVPAKDVPRRLQQLAAKHKVVLCIRQKYIRYKPFLAEVKDYACHRAGEPASAAKKAKVLKREPYASKRCGCGFRIRAILPIANYNEKDKTFVYQEEGTAVFKLYAVHSGHEPGPLDGNARIMHRMVGSKGGFLMDEETVYGMSDEMEGEEEGYGGDLRSSVLQQVHELKKVVGLLKGRIAEVPNELLGSVSQELFEVVNKLREIGESSSKPVDFLSDKLHTDDVLVAEDDLADWGDHRQLIEDDEDSFGQTLGEVATWDQIRGECRSEKEFLVGDSCKTEKWLKCAGFDEKSILNCEDSKLTKPMRHNDNVVVSDVDLVGAQVDSFYPDHHKWYDSPCLDPTTDCCDSGFKHGNFV